MGLLFAPGVARADDYNVTDCADLQSVFDASNPGDTVRLIEATCTGPFTLPSHTITFEGVGSSGLLGFADRALVGNDVGETTIRNLTFKNGAPASGDGGAIQITGLSSPTIEGCRFQDNQAPDGNGGAVSIRQNSATMAGTVTVRGNVFGVAGHPNIAAEYGGGT